MLFSSNVLLKRNFIISSSILCTVLLAACNEKDEAAHERNFASAGHTAFHLIEYSVDFSNNELTIPTASSSELMPNGFAASDEKVAAAMNSGCKYDIPAGTYSITSENSKITSIKGLDPLVGKPEPSRSIDFADSSADVTLFETDHEKFILRFLVTGPALSIDCVYFTR